MFAVSRGPVVSLSQVGRVMVRRVMLLTALLLGLIGAPPTQAAFGGSVTAAAGPVNGGIVYWYASCADYNAEQGGDMYNPYTRAGGSSQIVNGSFSVSDLAAGSYRVLIIPASGAATSWNNAAATCEQSQPVAITGDSSTQLLTASGATVSGTVTSSNGSVITGDVGFYATCEDYRSEHAAAEGSIAGGNYQVSVLPGTYRVRISPDDGYGSTYSWHSGKASCAESTTVTVTGDSTVNLVALNTYPVSGTVTVGQGTVNDGEVTFQTACQGGQSYTADITGGTYSVQLPAGTYRAEIIDWNNYNGSWHNAKSSCEQADPITVTGPRTADLVLASASSTQGSLVTGTVTGAVGGPAYGGLVFYATCSDYANSHPAGSTNFSGGSYATRVPDGTYRVRINAYNAAPSWHSAKAACADADTITVSGDTTANLVAAAGEAVHGTVTSSNGLLTSGMATSGSVAFYSTCDAPSVGTTTISGQGTYSTRLLPGTYRALIGPYNGTTARESWHAAKPACAQADTITVSGDTTADLVASPGNTLSGTATSSNGPIKQGWVSLYATCEDYRNGRSQGGRGEFWNGTYSVSQVPSGTYRVAIASYDDTDGAPRSSWHSGVPSCDQATPVTVNTTVTLNLVAATGYTVTGTVVAGAGSNPGPTPTPPTPQPSAPPVSTPSDPAPPVAGTTPPAAQAASAPRATLKKGKKVRLAKKTAQGAPLSWRTTTKKVCTVKKAKLKGLKKGTCRLQAKAPAVAGFSAFSQKFTIKVK